jgi:hypothetical protein
MMGQTFQYPNLLSGTRDGTGWSKNGHKPSNFGYSKSIRALYVQGTATKEFFLYSPPVVLHKNTDYTLHCLSANTANMRGTGLYVLDGWTSSDSYNWIGAHVNLKTPGPWGGWLDATFRLYDDARDGVPFRLRFDNYGSTDGSNCLIWFRDIMLTEGTEPHAWAPAEGEVWPE